MDTKQICMGGIQKLERLVFKCLCGVVHLQFNSEKMFAFHLL